MDSSLMAETHFLFSKGSAAPVVTPKKDKEERGRGMEIRGIGEEVGSRGMKGKS